MQSGKIDHALEDTGYTAYLVGRQAKRESNPIEVNPYILGTHESNEFIRGWKVEDKAQQLLRAM